MMGRVGGAARPGSKRASRGGRREDYMFHALRLSVSDILQGVIGLAEASGAHLVQVLGRTLLLYRPDGESPSIRLP